MPMSGRSSPRSATIVDGGINFSLYSRPAAGVELVSFDREDDSAPSRMAWLDPATNRTYHYWRVFVPALGTQLHWVGLLVTSSSMPTGRVFGRERFLLKE